MPKVRTIKTKSNGAEFETDLKVNSKGVFSAIVPDDNRTEITGDVAEDVERRWIKATREWNERSRQERRVIAVRFVSKLIEENQKRNFFQREQMLLFEALVCLEITTTQGEKSTVELIEHPEYTKMHGTPQPFCWHMQLDAHDLKRDGVVIIEWTPEIENTLKLVGEGIEKIATVLDGVLTNAEGIRQAAKMNTLTGFLAIEPK